MVSFHSKLYQSVKPPTLVLPLTYLFHLGNVEIVNISSLKTIASLFPVYVEIIVSNIFPVNELVLSNPGL